MRVSFGLLFAKKLLIYYKTRIKHIYVAYRFNMNSDSKELLELLQKVRRHSKKDAMSIMRGLAPEGQKSLLIELRRAFLELRGQARLSLPVTQQPTVEAPVRAKKVPYSLLLPPAMLDGLKALSEHDGAPVSHHIRLAIKGYLAKVR